MINAQAWLSLFTAAIASGESVADAEQKADAAWMVWQRRSGELDSGIRLVRAAQRAADRLGALHVVKTDPGCQAHIDALISAARDFEGRRS